MASAILFGATSMLGWSLCRARPPDTLAYCNASTRHRPPEIIGGIDLDDEPAVRELFSRIQPELIVRRSTSG